MDLGAESTFAAEKGESQIAVEVKSFVGPSDIVELERALGQFVLYRSLIKRIDPNRRLYLAIPQSAYRQVLAHDDGHTLIEDTRLALMVFDPQTERIKEWLP